MVSFCVFAKSHHRRFVSLPPRDLRVRRLLSPSPSPKSFPAISFADPHPLTPATSIFYKNRAGRGHVVRPLRPLDATLPHPLVCVANKELTQYLSALDATLTKNMGGGVAKSIYYFFLGFVGGFSGIAISIGVLAPAASSFFTDSGILSAFFTRTITCQICFSVSCPLNAGIPDNRIPFSTFQYDSHSSSSVTPVPLKSCGGAGYIPCATAFLGSFGRPWHVAHCSLYIFAPAITFASSAGT